MPRQVYELSFWTSKEVSKTSRNPTPILQRRQYAVQLNLPSVGVLYVLRAQNGVGQPVSRMQRSLVDGYKGSE